MTYNSIKNRLLASKLFKDSFWALLGTVMSKSLSLFAGIIVARILGAENYGEYGMIKSTLINISVFSTLGLGYASTRFIAKYLQENSAYVLSIIKNVIRITIYFSSIIFIIVFLFASNIALYLEVSETENAFRIAALIILANAINTTQVGILAGFKEFKATAINGTIIGISTFILSTLLTYYWGLDGSLVALLLSQIIGAIINGISIKKITKELCNQQQYVSSTKELLNFSIPITLQELLYTAVIWMSSVFMVKLSNYGEIGLLGAAEQWISVIYFIPTVLKNVALSYFASDGNENLLNRMLQINFISTFMLYILVIVFSGLITTLYGPKYEGLKIVLIIGTAQPIFTSLYTVILYEFIARNKTWMMFFMRFIREASNLVLVWIGLHVFTSNGAIVVSSIHVIVAIIFFIVIYVMSRKYLYKHQRVESNTPKIIK